MKRISACTSRARSWSKDGALNGHAAQHRATRKACVSARSSLRGSQRAAAAHRHAVAAVALAPPRRPSIAARVAQPPIQHYRADQPRPGTRSGMQSACQNPSDKNGADGTTVETCPRPAAHLESARRTFSQPLLKASRAHTGRMAASARPTTSPAVHMLIAYGSKLGSTREVAEAIASVLRDRDIDVEIRRGGERMSDVGEHAGVVVAGALYGGRCATIPQAPSP